MEFEVFTKKLAIGTGLVSAAVAGALFSPIGFAGAQDTDGESTDGATAETAPSDDAATDAATDDAAEASPDVDTMGHRHGRFGRLGGGEVLEGLGLTQEMLEAGRAADQSLAQIAEANGVSEAELTAALVEAGNERLADAVAADRITQERADEIAADLEAKVAEQINVLPSERPVRDGHHRFGRGLRAAGLEVLEDLGLTQEDLQTGREAGQTLAETAEANGVSEADLVDALVAAATEKAESAVEKGRFTQDQIDEFLDDIEARISERVNTVSGEGDGRGFGRGGHGGRFGGGGAAPSADAEVEGSSLSF